MNRTLILPLVAAIVLNASISTGAEAPDARCLAAKGKLVAKAFGCASKTQLRQVLGGESVDLSKCLDKLSSGFAKADNGDCPITGDAADAQDLVTAGAADLLDESGAATATAEEIPCIQSRTKAISKYTTCRQKSLASMIRGGDTLLMTVLQDCEVRLQQKLQSLDQQGTCPNAMAPGYASALTASGYTAGADLTSFAFVNGDLRGMTLSDGVLDGVDFFRAWITLADLDEASMDGASLVEASLNASTLRGTSLVGATATNADFEGADLTGAIFTNADLRDADLTYTVLADADFTGADLAYARFHHADMTGLQLSSADLAHVSAVQLVACPSSLPAEWSCLSSVLVGPMAYLAWQPLAGLNFDGANLSGADLWANLDGASLVGVNLTGANMVGASLKNADLTGSDLTNADLEASSLEGADLSSAVVSGADLDAAIMVGANLAGVDVSTASMIYTRAYDLTSCPAVLPVGRSCRSGAIVGPSVDLGEADLPGVDFSSLDFSNAQFSATNFFGANLSGTNFTAASLVSFGDEPTNLGNTNLTGANMMSADLGGVSFVGADLTGANLAGTGLDYADFANADLTGVNLDNAYMPQVTWDNTTCPDGTNSNSNGATCCGHHVGAAPYHCTP